MKNTLKDAHIDFSKIEGTFCHREVSVCRDMHIDVDYQKIPNVSVAGLNTIYVSLSPCFFLDSNVADVKFNQIFPLSKPKEYEDIEKNEPFFLRLILNADVEYIFFAVKLLGCDDD